MKFKMLATVLILILVVTACTVEEKPIYDAESLAEEARAEADVSIASTQTEIASQPTVEPTIEPTEVVATDTDEAAEDTADTETNTSSDALSEEEALAAAVANADIANGELLFTALTVPACNTCHLADTEAMLVGPGQYNIYSRTVENIENGVIDAPGPYTYIYESIINPGDYVVEGFANAMPDAYEALLTEQQLYDLVAYLVSLGD